MAKHKVAIRDKNGKMTHVWKKLGSAFTELRFPTGAPAVKDEIVSMTGNDSRRGDIVVGAGYKSAIVNIAPSMIPNMINMELANGKIVTIKPEDSLDVILGTETMNSSSYRTQARAVENLNGIYYTKAEYGQAGAMEAISEMGSGEVIDAIMVASEKLEYGTKALDQNDYELRMAEIINDINNIAATEGSAFAASYLYQMGAESRSNILYFVATLQKDWN